MKPHVIMTRWMSLFVGMLMSFPALAKDTVQVKQEKALTLQHIGMYKEYPVFELKMVSGEKDDLFTIVITDEAGNELYREKTTGWDLPKKYMLKNDETEEYRLIFKVYSRNAKKSYVFNVDREIRLVNESVISVVAKK
ncbi:MAG: hypothetical protein N2747_01585 [Chitinophagaceae bacterium]|nr:hypothetical protein [Chitinophagaceae bacterium]